MKKKKKKKKKLQSPERKLSAFMPTTVFFIIIDQSGFSRGRELIEDTHTHTYICISVILLSII